MELNQLNTMCDWERQKALFFMNYAENTLGMKLNSYGELAVNPTSGYTYLWLEDYPFCLYMEINCDLKAEDIYCMWTNSDNGDEEEMSCKDVTSIQDLYDFVERCEIDFKN